MKAQMKRIEDCAEVLAGLSLKARAEHESQGTHQVILMKHLKEDVPYSYNVDHELRITTGKSLERYTVKKGDILFTARGLRNEAIMVENVPENTVASSALYIIRGKNDVQTGYLFWILNQPHIKAKITQARTGAGTPLVQRAELLDIEIPVPNTEMQNKVISLNNLMTKERSLRNDLFEQSKCLHRAIGQQMFEQIRNG